MKKYNKGWYTYDVYFGGKWEGKAWDAGGLASVLDVQSLFSFY